MLRPFIHALVSGLAVTTIFLAVYPAQKQVIEFTAPTGPVATAPVDFTSAEEMVEREMHRLMGANASDCWERPEDRLDRWPTSAIVKRDGTVEVYRVAADKVSKNEWVLAWCEKGSGK